MNSSAYLKHPVSPFMVKYPQSFTLLQGGNGGAGSKASAQVKSLLLFFVAMKGIIHLAPNAEFTYTMLFFLTRNTTNDSNHFLLPF